MWHTLREWIVIDSPEVGDLRVRYLTISGEWGTININTQTVDSETLEAEIIQLELYQIWGISPWEFWPQGGPLYLNPFDKTQKNNEYKNSLITVKSEY